MLFCIPLLLFVVDIHYSIYFHQLDFDTKTSKRLAQEQDVTAQGFYLELIKFHRHLDTFRSQGVDGRGSWGEGILKKKRGGGKELDQEDDGVITWHIYESIPVRVHCIALGQSCISWQSPEPKDHPGLGRIAENKLTAALEFQRSTS